MSAVEADTLLRFYAKDRAAASVAE